MADLLNAISHSWPFSLAVAFLGWYPIFFAFLVVNSSRQFLLDRQGIVTQRLEPNGHEVLAARDRWPLVSVILSARNEERVIESCLASVMALAWPTIEVIVVDDGSTDETATILERHRAAGDIEVISHVEAQGKAASINEAYERSSGGIVLVIDADAELSRELVMLLAAQLHHHPDMGAVTANPRVLCTDRLIQKLQAIEFSATVAAQRRSHAAWGRISTMSGICTLFRREAIEEVGAFDPRQPAEDIEMTWRLQSRGWRVAYEPAAVVGTYAPSTLRAWIRQRRRWAAGLICALRSNWLQVLRPSSYATWPLLVEAVLSVLWCHLLVLLTAFWLLCLLSGAELSGNSLFAGAWGTLAAGVCTFQILWGIHLDRRYDRSIGSVALYAPLYPLGYWMMVALVAASATLPAALRSLGPAVTWESDRDEG